MKFLPKALLLVALNIAAAAEQTNVRANTVRERGRRARGFLLRTLFILRVLIFYLDFLFDFQRRGGECTPQVMHFEVWDADAQTSTGEVIDENNMDVCFPMTKASIEAVATDCTHRVRFELTDYSGNKVDRLERREPYLVYGNRIFADPPTVNGRFFKEGETYSISAHPGDRTKTLSYDFTVKYCESPSPTDCTPTQGVCAASHDDLQNLLDNAGPNEVVAICDGATIDTSADGPIIISQDELTMCCAGSDCVLENGDGSGRKLVVNGAAISILGIEFKGGNGAGRDGGNVQGETDYETVPGDNKIVDCTFRDGKGYLGGNLNVQLWQESTISIQKSSFIGGEALGLGGGVYMSGVDGISIRDCNFSENTAGWDDWTSAGGGLFIATEFGAMSKLEILDTSFDDNENGAVAVYGTYSEFTFSGNSGTGNTHNGSGEVCTDLYAWGNSLGCLELSDDFDYP